MEMTYVLSKNDGVQTSSMFEKFFTMSSYSRDEIIADDEVIIVIGKSWVLEVSSE